MNVLQEMKVFLGEFWETGSVQITGVNYIPKVPNKEDVIIKINSILQIENPTERAIEYMLYGMRAQLFWDGNKRISSICANKIMIENGCGIIKISDENLEQFMTLLSEFYNTNDNSKIKQFIYDNCVDGIILES